MFVYVNYEMLRLMIIYTFIFFLNVLCDGVGIEPAPPKKSNHIEDNSSNKQPDDVPIVNLTKLKTVQKTATQNTSTPKPSTSSSIQSNANSDIIESGAVMRGVYVFVGIAFLFIMYMLFKTYRRTARKNARVKKYGVRTRKTDTEMEPLPLDDEEEDETVFELRSVNNR